MKHRRRKKPQIMVPVASMGDLAFLLIIFFMVCSNFAKQRPVPATMPTSADVEQLRESQIFVAIDQHGRIYLQGHEMPDAQAVEWGVAALVKDKETDLQRTVNFRCDKDLTRDVYEPVIEAIAKAGALIAAVGEKPRSDTQP
jgi:biopolymer transport protein ExbD